MVISYVESYDIHFQRDTKDMNRIKITENYYQIMVISTFDFRVDYNHF